MDTGKRKKLEKAGWKVGSAEEFLELTLEEAVYVEMKAQPQPSADRAGGGMFGAKELPRSGAVERWCGGCLGIRLRRSLACAIQRDDSDSDWLSVSGFSGCRPPRLATRAARSRGRGQPHWTNAPKSAKGRVAGFRPHTVGKPGFGFIGHRPALHHIPIELR